MSDYPASPRGARPADGEVARRADALHKILGVDFAHATLLTKSGTARLPEAVARALDEDVQALVRVRGLQQEMLGDAAHRTYRGIWAALRQNPHLSAERNDRVIVRAATLLAFDASVHRMSIDGLVATPPRQYSDGGRLLLDCADGFCPPLEIHALADLLAGVRYDTTNGLTTQDPKLTTGEASKSHYADCLRAPLGLARVVRDVWVGTLPPVVDEAADPSADDMVHLAQVGGMEPARVRVVDLGHSSTPMSVAAMFPLSTVDARDPAFDSCDEELAADLSCVVVVGVQAIRKRAYLRCALDADRINYLDRRARAGFADEYFAETPYLDRLEEAADHVLPGGLLVVAADVIGTYHPDAVALLTGRADFTRVPAPGGAEHAYVTHHPVRWSPPGTLPATDKLVSFWRRTP
jgi:hypothetical protein